MSIKGVVENGVFLKNVIPAKAGIQQFHTLLDPRLRGDDKMCHFPPLPLNIDILTVADLLHTDYHACPPSYLEIRRQAGIRIGFTRI